MSTHKRVELGDEQLCAAKIIRSPVLKFGGSIKRTCMHHVDVRDFAIEIFEHLFLNSSEGLLGGPGPCHRPDFAD